MATSVCGYKDMTGNFFEDKTSALISDIATVARIDMYDGVYNPYSPSKQELIKIITYLTSLKNKSTLIEVLNVTAADL